MGNELRTALIGYAPEYGEKNNNILTYAGAGYGSKYALDEDKRSDSAAYGGMGLKYLANGGYLDPTKRNIVGERGPEEIVDTPRGFYVMPRKKRKTDAFFPTAPENYTPANRMPAMPDLSGGEPQGMTTQENISQLMNLQTKPKDTANTSAILPQGYDPGMPQGDLIDPNNQTQQKGGIYDDWKKPVFGNMPLDKFVQLTGMMANAIAPDEWSGRLGKQMAAVATQADIDRRDYEEREQERAEINKRYEEQKKESRQNRYLDAMTKTAKTNPALAKIFYDKWKVGAEEELGQPLPEWDEQNMPSLMAEIKQFESDATELGLEPEEKKAGMKAILHNAYGIKDDGKQDKDTITSNKGINPKTGKPEYIKQSGEFSGITPYEKPEKSGGGDGGGSNKSVKEAETRLNNYLLKARSDRATVVKLLDTHPEGDPKHNDLMNKLSGWDANIAQAEETLVMVQNGELRPEEIKWGGNKGGVKAKPLDAVTAAKILQEAGGDKNKARTIAKQRGYSF